ncbi:hypothetical protein ABFS83_02G056700 [Erythranthe nasuta]
MIQMRQIKHAGEWFNADSAPNSILVNAAEQLQIFTNGRCKSVRHRAVVNDKRERISIVVANGPAGDAVVGPAAALVRKDGRAIYLPMKYEEYVDARTLQRDEITSRRQIYLGTDDDR